MHDPAVDSEIDRILDNFLSGYAPENVRRSVRAELTRNLRIEEYDQP